MEFIKIPLLKQHLKKYENFQHPETQHFKDLIKLQIW